MVEFSFNSPIQQNILDSNFSDWQIVPTSTHHWSVHEVGLQMNLILRRQLWEGSERQATDTFRARSLCWPIDSLTILLRRKRTWPIYYIFHSCDLWLSIHHLICMTQDPYILFNTIVNLNWQYLTIDDREKSLFKKQKVNSNSESPVTCKC